MKLYHGRWDDSPKTYIGECDGKKEVYKMIYSYIPVEYQEGYLKWSLDEDGKQYIVDYGSWSDFIFIEDLNEEMLTMFR